MSKEIEVAAEKYADEFWKGYKGCAIISFKAGADFLKGENGIIIHKGSEVNCLLIGALRFLNEGQRVALIDALIARTPKKAIV